MKYLSNIDLSNNQLQNAVVHPLGTAPANPSDGQIYYNSTNGVKTLFLYDAELGAWKSIAGDITSVESATTGQLTVTNPNGPNPTFSIVTSAVVDGGAALATGDQVYDFVTNITDGKMDSITFQANIGSEVITDGETVDFDGGTGIETSISESGGVTTVYISQSTVSRSNTTSTATPANGGTFDVIDSITSDSQGNVTDVNTKTITLPTQTDGTVTSVDITPGALIDVAGGPITSSGSITIDVDLNELATTTNDEDADFIPVVDSIGNQKKIEPTNIPMTNFGNPDVDIDMDNNKIVDMADPTASQDAATKNYVDTSILGSGALIYQSGYNASTNNPDLDASPSASIKKGWTYTVTVEGLFFTEQVRAGDMLVAEQDNPTILAHWTVVQSNIDLASTTTVGIASFDSSNFTVDSNGKVSLVASGVVLGDDTDGDYVDSITVGDGLDITTATGEGSTPEISLDFNELTSATPDGADFVVGVDSTDNSTKKFLIEDIVSLNDITFNIVGDGTTTEFTSSHTLGFGVNIEVYDTYTSSPNYGETVYMDIKRQSGGTKFIFGDAPSSSQTYTAVIKKIG